MRILCVGINHKSADVAVREKLAFDAAQRARALGELSRHWGGAEFVILSTCNRTEVYTARPVHGHPRAEELGRWLGEFHGLAASDYLDCLYALADAKAAEHLFEVAAGLDSMVPGEDQIVAQIKGAYGEAVESGSAQAVMSDLFQGAFHLAKHVRSQTDIAAGKVSVASVAVQFVRHLFETLAGKCVLNVGAGKMNALMLRHLRQLGAERIVVVNRSADRAQRLAADCGGQAGDFQRLAEHLAEADVVLTSTGATEPIITAAMVRRAQKLRRYRPLMIVDIAVPRDVDPAAGKVDNVFLYNIDDLDGIVQGTLERRHGQRDAAGEIIAEHVEEFLAELNIRNVAPTIQALYRRMQALADQELADARNKLSSHEDAQEDLAILQRTLHRIVRGILHPCVSRLRESAGTDSARAHIAALRELFGLDEGEEEEEGHRS